VKNFLKIVSFIVFLVFQPQKLLSLEITLPKPSGPYSVGTKYFELKDESRSMLRDSTQRRWMVQSYYPSEQHLSTDSYRPETLENGTIADTRVQAHAKTNVPLFNRGYFPVVIFIPGLGHGRQDYTILCEELASYGYTILSLDQPYVSNFVKFSDGTTIVLTLKDVLQLRRDRVYRYQYYDEAMQAAINDIKYMMDHLSEISKSYFDNRLNTNLTLLMGHSFGGNVAHTLGFSDERVKAVVDIDSKITDQKIYGRKGVPSNPQQKPVLFIRAMMQYQEDVGDQLTKIQNAELWTPFVQHSAFTDEAYLVAYIPSIKKKDTFSLFLNWFFKTGPYFDGVDTHVGNQSVNQWFDDYRSHILTWLNNKLKTR
jgi:pimeloyl-ACP methyl ester carboxylesterase